MTDKNNKYNGEVKKRKFVLDREFDDPLLEVNKDMFEEIEVEEIPSYYKVHLGITLNKEENHDYTK